MKSNDFDKLAQAADLIKGLLDTMIYLEDARQDRQIPITILYPFETVLEKALLLLWEINKAEDGRDKAEM